MCLCRSWSWLRVTTTATMSVVAVCSHVSLERTELGSVSFQEAFSVVPKIEIVGYTLGDSHRSASSSDSFFQSMDTDKDGAIRASELASFVKNSIGLGSHSEDDDAEIQREVDCVMSKLDQDHDNSLQSHDVFGYWNQLETLLTVEEVAEWVVYSCQLPHEIGHVFRRNHVTGYDFPELVENDGEALWTELNIDKPTFRRRIVRLARARMLGLGSLPEAPLEQQVLVDVEHCSAVALSWKKTPADGFPVHSYRIQRRTLGGHVGETSRNIIDAQGQCHHDHPSLVSSFIGDSTTANEWNNNNVPEKQRQTVDSISISTDSTNLVSSQYPSFILSPSSPTALSEWQNIYVGAETQFVDTHVEKGKEYTYRIQAWNPIGRSEWTTIHISTIWKKLKCHVPPKTLKKTCTRCTADSITSSSSSSSTSFSPSSSSTPQHIMGTNTRLYPNPLDNVDIIHHSSNWMWKITEGLAWISSWIVTFSRAFLAITAVFAALMKFRRMNLHTTTSSGEPIFPWLSRRINQLSRKYIGSIIFPHYVTGDEKLKKKSSILYDREVNAVGLFGYKQSLVKDRKNNSNKDYRNAASTTHRSTSDGSSTHILQRELSTQSLSMDMEYSNRGNSAIDTSDSIGNRLLPRSLSSSTLLHDKTAPSYQRNPSTVDQATTTDMNDFLPCPSTMNTIPSTIHHRRLFSRRKFLSFPTKRKHKTYPPIIIEQKSFPPESTHSHIPSSVEEDRESCYSVQSPDSSHHRDDFDRCNTCQELYKFPKRFRHHCARCTATFCHKHGRTTHSNLISCKVPGNCVCLQCLQKDSMKTIHC